MTDTSGRAGREQWLASGPHRTRLTDDGAACICGWAVTTPHDQAEQAAYDHRAPGRTPSRKGARLRAGCKDFQHDSCTAGLACSSVFDQRSRTSDTAKAHDYQRIHDRMRADASSYRALAEMVLTDPELLTFSQAYADGLRRRYEGLAVFCDEAAEQAGEVARHYAAAARGEDMTLGTTS